MNQVKWRSELASNQQAGVDLELTVRYRWSLVSAPVGVFLAKVCWRVMPEP